MSLLQSTGALSVTCKRCKNPKTIHFYAGTQWTDKHPVCRECTSVINRENRLKYVR